MHSRSRSKQRMDIKPSPSFDAEIISEPRIAFGGRHEHIDPKVGLSLYGPYTPSDQYQLSLTSLIIGIIGTSSMIGDAYRWLGACKIRLENNGEKPFLYPHFPGFNKGFPFCCEMIFGDTWEEIILQKEIRDTLEPSNYFTRIKNVVKLYTSKIENLSQREPKPHVILCCIPQEIIDHCTTYLNRAKEEVRLRISSAERKAMKVAATGQGFLFPYMDPNLGIEGEEFGHQNLRRGLKAQAMRFGIPTQLVWPRTLQLGSYEAGSRLKKPLQDVATRAWNFTTALYHKAGATPWRLSQVDPDVCFVGISFYREIGTQNPKLRTSLAQTFTAAGDAFVLRGKTFEWDRPGPSPHLDEASASALIRDVLEMYQRHRKSLPTRIVVHKSSRFWTEELRGFQEATRIIPLRDFIAFGSRGIQFYRGGDYPPLRGTYIKFNDSNFLLYTSGYVPFLRSYPGARAPMPLEILEHYGDSPYTTILREILALTKMNWNTAYFACADPITIAFSTRVGQIMAEIPDDVKPRSEYRYYM